MIWKVGQRVKFAKARKNSTEKYVGTEGIITSIGPFPAGYYFGDSPKTGRPRITKFNNDCVVNWYNGFSGAVCFWQLEPLQDLTEKEKLAEEMNIL